nr:hypothetical protein [Vibrio vulnificus]
YLGLECPLDKIRSPPYTSDLDLGEASMMAQRQAYAPGNGNIDIDCPLFADVWLDMPRHHPPNVCHS